MKIIKHGKKKMIKPNYSIIDLKRMNYKCPFCGNQKHAIKGTFGSEYMCDNCGMEIFKDLFPKDYYKYNQGQIEESNK